MHFSELNWMDVEAYLKKDDRVIVILGACEQHGYLSLLTDQKIPTALADAASQKTGVLIGPEVNMGVSPYFMEYPGTISIKLEHYLPFVEDVLRSLYKSGFRKILILNGHGGNEPARTQALELVNELPDIKIAWYAWWLAPSCSEAAGKHGLKCYHAGWMEAFPFTIVSDLPNGEKESPVFKGILNAKESREIYGDGVFGGPYHASGDVLTDVFNACLQDILYLLEF